MNDKLAPKAIGHSRPVPDKLFMHLVCLYNEWNYTITNLRVEAKNFVSLNLRILMLEVSEPMETWSSYNNFKAFQSLLELYLNSILIFFRGIRTPQHLMKVQKHTHAEWTWLTRLFVLTIRIGHALHARAM